MNPLVIYCSVRGHTKTVVEAMGFPACSVLESPQLDAFDPILFFCPTYGDEELPVAMEEYLTRLAVRGKQFGVCELGNYYGFDDPEFGAMKIIKHELERLGWQNTVPNLSLDSLPRIDWSEFETWKENVYEVLETSGVRTQPREGSSGNQASPWFH